MNNQDSISRLIHSSINAGRNVGLCEALGAVSEWSNTVACNSHLTNEEKALVCAYLCNVGNRIDALRKNIESEPV